MDIYVGISICMKVGGCDAFFLLLLSASLVLHILLHNSRNAMDNVWTREIQSSIRHCLEFPFLAPVSTYLYRHIFYISTAMLSIYFFVLFCLRCLETLSKCKFHQSKYSPWNIIDDFIDESLLEAPLWSKIFALIIEFTYIYGWAEQSHCPNLDIIYLYWLELDHILIRFQSSK